MKGPPLYDPTPFGNDRTGNRRYALYPAGGGINEIPPAFDKRAGRDGFVSLKGRMGDFLRALGDTYGNRIIVLGRGAEGAAMYLREENRIFALPAVQVGEIVNTVGTGDALFSGFLHHFARGYRPLDALARAQVFASAKIRVSGAANGFPAEKEMESLCREYAGRMEYYEV